jgi:hypothetical protein
VEAKTYPSFGKINTITFKEIIAALLELFDTTKSKLSRDLILTGIKILRKMIEIENKDYTTPSSEWDTDHYSKYKMQIENKQELLIEHSCVEFICKFFAISNDEAIVNEYLLCLISLLLGGNSNTQQHILDYMIQDDGNQKMIKIRKIVNKCFEETKRYLLDLNT